LRNLALSSPTSSPNNASPISTDRFIHANCASSNVLHNLHKRSSGRLSLSTDDGNHAKRTRRFRNLDSQNDSDEPSLQEGRANGDDIPGNVVKPRGLKSASGLSRQQFTRFRLSPKRLRFVFRDFVSFLDTNTSFTENRNTRSCISRCPPL
jgi:hypothetical protein